MWNDLIYGIGDMIFASFALLEMGSDAVNWFFIGMVAFILVAWVLKQVKYNKEAQETGGYE